MIKKSNKQIKEKKTFLWPVLAIVVIVVFYLLSHLWRLTLMPVFADEAIYIRWTQLMMDDWKQYAFFPMNDGKPPLHMWLMLPFQYLFPDQLFAGRFLSVLVGLTEIFVLGAIVKKLGGRNKATLVAMLLSCILPFWYLHQRMALIDALMTLFLSLSFYFLLKLSQKISLWSIVLTGLFFGLALMSKLPAILFIFVFAIVGILVKNKSELIKYFFAAGSSLFFGLVIFACLKIHPAFGQLFARGSDFLYPMSDFFAGKTIVFAFGNALRFFGHMVGYQTWPIVLLSFSGLFFSRSQKHQFVLWLALLSYLAPIVLLGKVVYPRYLLPIAIFSTVSAVLSLQDFSVLIAKTKNFAHKFLLSIFVIICLSVTAQKSAYFIYQSLNDYNQIPLVYDDKTQYLYEWSAGFGIKEVVDYIQEQAVSQKVVLATEGYFGTLPDGVLMYLHGQDVTNIFVEGIGQPVAQIPDSFVQKTKGADQTLLLVNSHRLRMKLDEDKLLKEYCRPDDQGDSEPAQCLQLWDISSQI